MNPLVSLNEKLRIKPIVQNKEPVVVVIKGTKKGIQPKALTEKGKIEERIQITKEKTDAVLPVIIDETKKGYDRMAFIKKLAESKKPKGTITKREQINDPLKQPQIELEQEPIKLKAKKIKIPKQKQKFIIDEDEEVIEQPKSIIEQVEVPKISPKPLIIEDEDIEPEEIVPIQVPLKKKRLTKKPQKVKAIGLIDENVLVERMPPKMPQVLIKVSKYYMNNREIFINFINSIFEPYRREIAENKTNISCETIGETSTDFSLLTHQKIVRDYINLYTPYRGLLLYHGLGSGKTCTSIAIAEGMKSANRVIIMTPASLRANYIDELKKCGDLLYKRNQYWEWISIKDHPEALNTISVLLNLPEEYIRRKKGAFFINVNKPSNYEKFDDLEKRLIEDQLNKKIEQKYTFINYNGLRAKKLSEITNKFTTNIFDNSVVVIDEAHNLISRIVNKIKKEKSIDGEKKKKKRVAEEERMDENIFGDQTPVNLATKLYYMLLRAKNMRVVLLSGTPVINYPNEFAIIFNILRGYIKTWKFRLNINTTNKIDRDVLKEMLLGIRTHDYLDYSPASKTLTITRNPFGFKNKIIKDAGYSGVSNVKDRVIDNDFTSDDEFERNIIHVLRTNNIDVIPQNTEIINNKALPDDLETFMTRYINFSDKSLKNVDSLKRRVIGLSSYFKSAQEGLLPKYDKIIGVDYHIVRVPMSDTQFKIYEGARKQEREMEKKKKKPSDGDLFEEKSSTYRIFSRLYCNYIILDRPIPGESVVKKDAADLDADDSDVEEHAVVPKMAVIIKEGLKLEKKQDIDNDREGEIEGDEIIDNIGGIDYKERLDRAIANIKEHSNDFLTPEALQTYSPKFLHMLENIQEEENEGLHLVYSQFRTAEGIGVFSLVLEKNGFARFRIKKNNLNLWEIDIPEVDEGKPTYALYTGTETSEEKEILRKIYNGEWDKIPDSIGHVLKSKYRNNNMGEVIKVLMITSSGSEGINLRNTRFVHIMEPYWHPVRLEQVIGRARRICSHKDLPKELQTVEVFVYIMIFSEAQLKSDAAIELNRKDLSKAIPHVPITSDQFLFEISEIKANLTSQLTDIIKETAFDCYIYSNGKCVNFGDPSNDKFSYVPDYTQQQNDATAQANKKAVEWTGKPITINGIEYVARRMSDTVFDLYDKETYQKATQDPNTQPLKIGTYELNSNGDAVVKLI